ncbi:MAG: hypothetical protein QOJ99_5576, partial [Bryobacterales bacterium]|nr:hypothetical protein [Bryobacterales bacterium]
GRFGCCDHQFCGLVGQFGESGYRPWASAFVLQIFDDAIFQFAGQSVPDQLSRNFFIRKLFRDGRLNEFDQLFNRDCLLRETRQGENKDQPNNSGQPNPHTGIVAPEREKVSLW